MYYHWTLPNQQLNLSIPLETVLHKLHSEPFPQAAVLHELLFRASLSQSAVLQEQVVPGLFPHRVTSLPCKSAPNPCRVTVLSSRGHRSCQVLAPVQASQGVTASVNLPAWSPPQAAGGSLLHHEPPRAAGAQLLHQGCRGIFAPVPEMPPPLPFSLPLMDSEVLFFSHIIPPLSICSFRAFSLFKFIFPEALSPSLVGSALARGRSILEPASIGSVEHGSSFCQLLREDTPVVPCYQNLTMQMQYNPFLISFVCQLKCSYR